MSALSPGLEAALDQPSVLIFHAVELVLPDAALRLLDGAGEVSFAGKAFLGEDPTYGVLAHLDPFEDGADGQAPSHRLSIQPPTNAAAAALASVAAQGALVSIWFGALDPESGIVIDEPDLVFVGEVDVPKLTVGKRGRLVELECASAWDRFFRSDEGARLTDAFHQSIWPGELGLEFVTNVQQQLPWGADLPRPSVVRDIPASGGGGGWGGGGSFTGNDRPDFL